MSTDRLRRIVLNYARMTGVHPFSYDFVWNASCARHRFERVHPGMSLLEAVLRCELKPEERAAMFPGKFDLGSRRAVAPGECTLEKLADEIVVEGRIKALTVGDLRHTINQITDITGTSFQDYRKHDCLSALKVVKLFWCLKHAGHKTVLSMIRRTGDAAQKALELSNPYPAGAGDAKRRLFSDLKAHLLAGIDSERLQDIDSTFSVVRDRLGAFLHRVNTVLKSAPNEDGGMPSIDDIRNRFAVVSEAWLPRQTSKLQRCALPLDQQMYMHVNALDFLDFATIDGHLRTSRIGQVAVAAVHDELAKIRTRFRVADFSAAVPELAQFAPLIGKAMGRPLDAGRFRKLLPDAGHCLRHYLATCAPGVPDDVDALTAAAALAFALVINDPRFPPYKPYMQGQQNISGSIRTVMRHPVNSAHEEFERVCRYAIDWYRYALVGAVWLAEIQNAFERGMIDLVAQVCQSHDTRRMENLVRNLDDYGQTGVENVPMVVHARRQAVPVG